jgi:hypothetical protein
MRDFRPRMGSFKSYLQLQSPLFVYVLRFDYIVFLRKLFSARVQALLGHVNRFVPLRAEWKFLKYCTFRGILRLPSISRSLLGAKTSP